MVSALDEQDTTDTLALLVQCEKKLSVMLEVLGKAATGSAPKATSETTFIAEPVFHSNNVRVRPSGPAVKLEALPSTRSASSVSDVRVGGMGREGMGQVGACMFVSGGGGGVISTTTLWVWGRLQPADVGVPLCVCCSCIGVGVGGDLYGAGCTCVLLQSEDKEGGESDDESTSERVLFDRSALKKKAKKKEADELRRRETEARRAAMAAKIAVDLDKVRVTCPEAVCWCMAVIVCRLADCHRARFFLLSVVVGCCRKRQWSG